MDLDSARARGDLSAIKRSSASAAKAPRVPHPDSDKIVTNTDADAWALRVLQRKQSAGEALDAQQLATLERLGGSGSGGGSAAPAAAPSRKIVVVTGRSGGGGGSGSGSGSGKVIKVVGQPLVGARVISKKFGGGGLGAGGSSSSSLGAGAGSRVISKKFGGGGGAAATKPLTTADKLGMSLDDLSKQRRK